MASTRLASDCAGTGNEGGVVKDLQGLVSRAWLFGQAVRIEIVAPSFARNHSRAIIQEKLPMIPNFVGVTGLPRAGSTLVCQLLAQHPEIESEGLSSPL